MVLTVLRTRPIQQAEEIKKESGRGERETLYCEKRNRPSLY
jgi:hypothetical protein